MRFFSIFKPQLSREKLIASTCDEINSVVRQLIENNFGETIKESEIDCSTTWKPRLDSKLLIESLLIEFSICKNKKPIISIRIEEK